MSFQSACPIYGHVHFPGAEGTPCLLLIRYQRQRAAQHAMIAGDMWGTCCHAWHLLVAGDAWCLPGDRQGAPMLLCHSLAGHLLTLHKALHQTHGLTLQCQP